MAEIDTSTYPKSALPVSALDTAGQIGGLLQRQQSLQSGALSINQQKLDQTNQALTYMTRAMASVGPDGTKDDYLKVGQNAVKMGLVPEQMLQTYEERLQAAPDARSFFNEFIAAAATHQQMLDWHMGQQGTMDTGQGIQPVAISPKFGIRSTGLPIQKQVPPTTPVVGPGNVPQLQGPQASVAAPGAVTAPPAVSLPVAAPRAIMPAPTAAITSPVNPAFRTPIPIKNQSQVPQGNPASPVVAGGPTGPVTGLAPGVKEAADVAGHGAGAQLADARLAGARFQRDIFPLMQAIPALERLGTKGTGPGTETINNLKSFVLSNVPGIKASDFKNTVEDYDLAKKYLTDYVNQTGNSGTNDKLAAAFAGNPSVHISNAAASDVAKAALSLRFMQQAQLLEFEKLNLPPDQFPRWVAQRTNEYDPRAFGVNMMDDAAKAKLKSQLAKAPQKERDRFENTLKLGVDFGFMVPPK